MTLLPKITAATSEAYIKQELDMHRLKLSSHQPYKVGLLLLQERNEDLLGKRVGKR